MEQADEIFPKHIAIIMDGNRRWAKQRNMPAVFGHKEGAENFRRISKYANKIGVKYLTVYAFSTENWKRSKDEVEALMNIFQTYIDNLIGNAKKENLIIHFLGDMSGLSEKLKKSMINAMETTKDDTGLVVNICLNYGGRHEITGAMKNIAERVKNGEINPEDITEDMISDNLYTAGMPDPDLVIRTSNELRLSNFLPWQSTYSEFYFTPRNWPEFGPADLDEAILEYKKRNRKFGGK